MSVETHISSTSSRSGLLFFVGGIALGGAVAAALVYAYSGAYQDGRSRNRKTKGSQRYGPLRQGICAPMSGISI